ncbi:hypothetical protein BKA69DRAFT_854567 [Paraphysoderma sedebokerense]|nr:hypothetical protein BKA69DRAFT_854567 [Paraphysoderma sedebokerense]
MPSYPILVESVCTLHLFAFFIEAFARAGISGDTYFRDDGRMSAGHGNGNSRWSPLKGSSRPSVDRHLLYEEHSPLGYQLPPHSSQETENSVL